MSADLAYPVETEQVDPRFAEVGCFFFVIGAQKGGTTWLSHYFRDHPNIAVPYWKEHNFWNMVEGRPDPGRSLLSQVERRKSEGLLRRATAMIGMTQHAKRQRAITLALRATEQPRPPYSAYADAIFETANANTCAAGELCPQYAHLKAETYAKMAALSQNTRFIYMLRDPVSRMISGARHSLRKNKSADKTPQTFSKLLHSLAHRAAEAGTTHSNYDVTIARLESRVSPDRIKYVFFEELFDQARVKEICDFLGAPFVPGNIARKRNSAGEDALSVSDADRAMLARALGPIYDFCSDRFGVELPAKWRESAELRA